MPPRFFAPNLGAGTDLVALSREEARHLTRVLRLGAGDTVTVFDGRGNEFLARVEDVARHQVAVRPLRRTEPAAEPSVTLTLAQAVLKGNKLDHVVRDATMLGVAVIQPLLTLRANVPASARRQGGAVARWQRIAVASAKQCRRVPEVRPPLELERFVGVDESALRICLVEAQPSVRKDPWPRRLASRRDAAIGNRGDRSGRGLDRGRDCPGDGAWVCAVDARRSDASRRRGAHCRGGGLAVSLGRPLRISGFRIQDLGLGLTTDNEGLTPTQKYPSRG